jgi:hypothetical protein
MAIEEAGSKKIPLSKSAFGHTFLIHGEDLTEFLTKRAGVSKQSQGQFFDDQAVLLSLTKP